MQGRACRPCSWEAALAADSAMVAGIGKPAAAAAAAGHACSAAERAASLHATEPALRATSRRLKPATWGADWTSKLPTALPTHARTCQPPHDAMQVVG